MAENDVEFTANYTVSIIIDEEMIKMEADDIFELYFVEDIMSPSMSGKITFRDKYGINEFAPLVGEEKIVIDYGETENRQLVFEVWKVKSIRQGSLTDPTTENFVEIYFTDIIFLPLILRKYSRSFGTAATYSSIVQHILQNILEIPSKYLSIDTTTNTIDNFIIPYWTPLATIKWLASSSVDENGSGFLFYTSTEEVYRINYRNINTLFSTDNLPSEDPFVFEDKNLSEKTKVLEWWINGLDKFSTKFLRGGKNLGFDFTTKSLLSEDYTYEDGINDSILTGRKSLYPDISDTETNIFMMGYKSSDDLKQNAAHEWVMRYSMQQIVNLIVRGEETRYAGQQIELKWPSYDKKTQIYNKMLKGYFLIKSITHMFTGDISMPYRQRLVLMKNAYYDADSDELLDAVNMNVSDVKLGRA